MAAELPLQMPAAPEGFCNSLNDANWVQNLLNLIAQGVAVFEGSGFTTIISQSTQPGATDRDKLWYDPDVGRFYIFTGGAWVTPHPEPPGPNSYARRWWAGTLADLITYDGGTAGAVGANSGPMWEEDTDMIGRSPMHPGNIPTANPVKVLAVNENYGEGAHQMTAQEVGPHSHPLNVSILSTVPGAGAVNGIEYNSPTGTGNVSVPPNLLVNNNTYSATQQNMPVIHPVRGLYCIKRTGRLNYVGS